MIDVPSMSITLPSEEAEVTALSSCFSVLMVASGWDICSLLEEITPLLEEVAWRTWGESEHKLLDKLL